MKFDFSKGITPSIAGHCSHARSFEIREACDEFFRRRGMATGPGSSPWQHQPAKKTNPRGNQS